MIRAWRGADGWCASELNEEDEPMTQTQDIFGTAREMGFEITEGPISQGRVVILRQNDGGGHEAWMWVDEDGQTILEDQGDGTCHLPIPDEAVASTLAGYAE